MCVYICHTFLIRTLQCVLSTAIMGISEVHSAVCLVYRVQMRHMQQHHTACHGHRHPNVMCAHGYPVDSVDLPRCHYRLTIRSTWLWLSVPASCLSIRLYLLFFFFCRCCYCIVRLRSFAHILSITPFHNLHTTRGIDGRSGLIETFAPKCNIQHIFV